jgi:hypothetical protein
MAAAAISSKRRKNLNRNVIHWETGIHKLSMLLTTAATSFI